MRSRPCDYLKKYLFPLILLLFLVVFGSCKRKSSAADNQFDALITPNGIDRTLQNVIQHNLTRVKPGSPEEAHVANWLADTFSHYGLKPGGKGETYFVEFPLPDNSLHTFSRDIVAQATGMRTLDGGILLTTIYDHLSTEEPQADSDAVKASASRMAVLLEIANATAGRPGDTPIYFSARSEHSIPEAKGISTVLDLRNGHSADDSLRIYSDSIPGQWQTFLENLSDSTVGVIFHYNRGNHHLPASVNVKMNIYLPTKVWIQAATKNEYQKGLDDIAHSAQIIRRLLYRLAMLQPQIPGPDNNINFSPNSRR